MCVCVCTVQLQNHIIYMCAFYYFVGKSSEKMCDNDEKWKIVYKPGHIAMLKLSSDLASTLLICLISWMFAFHDMDFIFFLLLSPFSGGRQSWTGKESWPTCHYMQLYMWIKRRTKQICLMANEQSSCAFI